jgi:hypothetical protein
MGTDMVRLLAACMLVALSACATGGGVTAGQDFTMATAQRVTLPDASTLRYIGIANDSRCPPDVQCIRAGDADVLFDYHGGAGTPTRIILNTERTPSADAGRWRLQLVDLAPGPAPRVTVRVDSAAPAGVTSP